MSVCLFIKLLKSIDGKFGMKIHTYYHRQAKLNSNLRQRKTVICDY